MQQVNWDYVSLPCILDVIKNQPLVKKGEVFRREVYRQFVERNARKSLESDPNEEEESDEPNSKQRS